MKIRLTTLLVFCVGLIGLSGCNRQSNASNPNKLTASSHQISYYPKKKVRRIQNCLPGKDIVDGDGTLSLGEVVDLALSHNPETKEAWADARIAAALYGQSQQNDYVNVNLTSDFSRSRLPAFFSGVLDVDYQTRYGGQLQFDYLIFDFGETRLSSYSALNSLYAANWEHNQSIQSVILDAMESYFNYLYQKALVAAVEQDVGNAQVSFDAVEERFRMGLADIADRVQAKTKLLQEKLRLVAQKQTKHKAYTTLISEMGIKADTEMQFQSYPEEIIPVQVENLDQLIAEALSCRPSIIALEADVRSKQYALKSLKRKRFPKLKGEFDIGRRYFEHGLNDRYNFKAAISLEMPLFQGFFIENQVRQAQGNLKVAEAKLSDERLQLYKQVSDTRTDLESATLSIEYAKAFYESAKEDFRLNLEKYLVGTGTIVELINAQTAVSDAQAQLSRVQRDWYVSLANIYYVTGDLCDATPLKQVMTP